MQNHVTLTNSEIAERISENIHSARNRRIMQMKLIDGMTYEQIAETVEMSPRQIKNIVKRCREILFPNAVFTEICFS